jgi:hypothetical protein
MKRHIITSTMTITRQDQEIEVAISGTFLKGCKEVRYLRNGDPGFPAEPDEITDLEATLRDGDEAELTEDEYDEAYQMLIERAYEEMEEPK